jgi:hypothetical protein
LFAFLVFGDRDGLAVVVTVVGPAAATGQDVTPTRESGEQVPAAEPGQEAVEQDGEEEAGTGVDDARMSELMAGLKAEEPSNAKFYWLGNAIAGVLALIGAVLMIWGIVAFQATQGKGLQGSLGAGVMMFFGVGFIAVAGWVIYKNLQRQGVL